MSDLPADTERLLRAMEALALNGSMDPAVRKNAMRIVLEYEPSIPRKAYIKEIQALFEYAQGTHPTLKGLKLLKQIGAVASPPATEKRGGGDAADLAVWLAAHLYAIGHGPARYVVVSTKQKPDLLSHLYVQVRHQDGPFLDREDGSRWLPLDPTVSHPMGWERAEQGKKVFFDIVRPE